MPDTDGGKADTLLMLSLTCRRSKSRVCRSNRKQYQVEVYVAISRPTCVAQMEIPYDNKNSQLGSNWELSIFS